MTKTLELGTPIQPTEKRLRTIRIALAGCGVVGGEVVRQIDTLNDGLATRYGLRVEVVCVLVRDTTKDRQVPLESSRITSDIDRFLGAEADVVVEAIGGIDPALRIAREALLRRRRLITANKALIAVHGPELYELSRKRPARFDFESAVAGGIPIVRTLRDQLHLAGILRVRGILNGTTNFILSRLADGARYADALAEAQEAGYAEADPTRDVQGLDAEDKIRILAWLSFGLDPASLPVRTRGIAQFPDRLAADARALGGVPRLVAEAVRWEDSVTTAVEPFIVSPNSPLAGVRGPDNYVAVETVRNGTVRLVGPGAGGGATASAILGDVIRGARRVRPARSTLRAVPENAPHDWCLSVESRADAADRLRATLDRAALSWRDETGGEAGTRVVVEAAPWRTIDLATLALAAVGLHPVLSRIDAND